MGVFADKAYENGRYILSDESRKQILEMNKLMHGLTMEDLRILVGSRFRFPIYPDADYMQLDILNLDLSQRALNSLKRGNIFTISELTSTVNAECDLRSFRNLGAKTAKEIMLSLFFYQYSHIAETARPWYMNRLLELNGIYKTESAA